MRFAYPLIKVRKSVHSLGGRWVRPRPLVLVTLVGPKDVHVQAALLDTGSDDTVFPVWVAHKLGVDLTAVPSGEASGVGGTAAIVRYAELQLRLTDGQEYREWPAWIGFTTAQLNQPLLGFAGCLQFFDAQFLGAREELELTVNPLYPGT